MNQATSIQSKTFSHNSNTSFVTPEKRTIPKEYSPGKKPSHKISDEKMA